jgi:hypothetical protein
MKKNKKENFNYAKLIFWMVFIFLVFIIGWLIGYSYANQVIWQICEMIYS